MICVPRQTEHDPVRGAGRILRCWAGRGDEAIDKTPASSTEKNQATG